MPVDASTAGEATPADLTARARVRNAALAQFAERPTELAPHLDV